MPAPLTPEDEIKSKPDWKPDAATEKYLAKRREEWQRDYDDFTTAYDHFQRKSLSDYMAKNEADSYVLWNQTRKEPWRNNTRLQKIPAKLDAVAASVADLNLVPEWRSFDLFKGEIPEVGDALDSLDQIARSLNEQDEKDKLAVKYLLTHGTEMTETVWMKRVRAVKRILSEDSVTGECEWADDGKKEDEGRVWSRTFPLNRAIWGDITQQFADLQPRLWKKTVMTYAEAEALYGKNLRFDFVKPYFSTTDEWLDIPSQQQLENPGRATPWCIRLEREDVPENCYDCIINGVLMTQPNRPMPGKSEEKHYSLTVSRLFPFVNGAMYGQSLVQRMHNDAVLADFWTNAVTDWMRKKLDPPIVTSFRTVYSKYMNAPGKVTQVGGDFDVKNLMDGMDGGKDAMAMFEFTEKNLDEACGVPNPAKEAVRAGKMTADEYRLRMKEALKTAWNVFSAVAEMKRRHSEARMRLIVEHYPELGIGKVDGAVSDALGGFKKVFTASGKDGTRKIAFVDGLKGKMGVDARRAVSVDENVSKILGKPHKWTILDKDGIRNMRHSVYVAVDPNLRKSKESDKLEAGETYDKLVLNPVADQEWNLKEYLRLTKGSVPDGAVKKAQPQPTQVPKPTAQPGSPMPQPGNPMQGAMEAQAPKRDMAIAGA